VEASAREWHAACTTDGVRITSATLSSSPTVLPPAKTDSSKVSFQAAMAHASTENSSEQSPTSDTAMSSSRGNAQDHAGDGTDALTAGSAEQGNAAVANLSGSCLPTSGDTTAADDSLGTATPCAGAVAGVTGSEAVESSGAAFIRQAAAALLATGFGSSGSPVPAIGAPAVKPSTGGVAAKQDRSKTPTEPKKATAAMLIASVADPDKLPMVNVVSLQAAAHGQDGGAESAVKSYAFEKSVGTHAKAAAPIGGPGTADAGSTLLSAAADGSPQGASAQAPADPFEPGSDMSMASAVPTSSELANPVDLSMPTGTAMGTSSAPAGNSVSSSVSDRAGILKSSATGTIGMSSQGAADAQAAQGAPVDAAKTGAGVVGSRTMDSGAAQTTLQTPWTLAGSHGNPTIQSATTHSPDPAHVGKAAELPPSTHPATDEGAPATGINSGKLIQTMGETEMHVGMHSVEFGDISIRTSLNQQQMVTQISVAHSDLSQTISSHVSAVQMKLGEEYGLHASIQVSNSGMSMSGGQGSSSQRDQPSRGRSTSEGNMEPIEMSQGGSSIAAPSSTSGRHGLDITV
jgi:hypothetical protein